jgi:hypothetical protein
MIDVTQVIRKDLGGNYLGVYEDITANFALTH